MKIIRKGNYIFIRHFLEWYIIDQYNYQVGKQPKRLFGKAKNGE